MTVPLNHSQKTLQGLQKCNFSTLSTILGTGFGDQKYAKTLYLCTFQKKFIFFMADLGQK